MAEKKKDKPEVPELTKRQREVITRATSRVEKGLDFVREDFGESLEDLRMCNNEEHWDATILAKRQQAGRPSLTLNEFIPALRDIKGEQAETKPYTVIRPVGGGATQETADLMSGYMRNIKYKFKADDAYDWAFGQQTQGGFGYYRVLAEFDGPQSFDQTIKVKPILNQFSVVFDENAEEWHKNDGEWMAVLSYFSKEEFERRWPGVTPQNFSATNLTWYPVASNQKKFMVAEYYEKEHKKETLFQLEDGKVIKANQIPEGIDRQVGSVMPDLKKIVKKRVVDGFTIYRYLLCAHAVLEDREEWPCDLWSIIPVDGDKMAIQNKVSRRSLIRFGKDGQRALNLYESTKAEVLSMVPKAPVHGTAAMFEGYEDQWLGAMDGTYPYLLRNSDPMEPGGKPERLFALDPSYIGALAQSTQQSKEAVRAAIGPNPMQAMRASQNLPQVSGSALGRWQQEGDITTFIFFDNLQKAVEQGDLVIVRLMKRILDTNMVITIRKADGSSEDIEINKPVQEMDPKTQQPVAVIKNDFTKGEYAVETTLGPTYAVQKEALSDKMINFARALPPQIMAGTAHIIAGMLFDIQSGQEAQGGALMEFVKQVKKILLKMGLLDPTDLKQEELKDFAPMLLMMRQKPMPPAMASKLRVEAGKAAALFARAEKDLATVGQVKAENAMQIMEFLRVLGIAAMEPMTPPQLPGQPAPGKAGQSGLLPGSSPMPGPGPGAAGPEGMMQ